MSAHLYIEVNILYSYSTLLLRNIWAAFYRLDISLSTGSPEQLGRRQSTANDANATTAVVAALLRNEWRQTSISHASRSRMPSIERPSRPTANGGRVPARVTWHVKSARMTIMAMTTRRACAATRDRSISGRHIWWRLLRATHRVLDSHQSENSRDGRTASVRDAPP